MSESARDRIWGSQAAPIAEQLKDLDPDLADLILRVVYGEVFEREGLDMRTRELLAVAHLMSVGSAGELETHLRGALRNGSSHTELKEVILHAAMFIGFPKAVQAMRVLKRLKEV